jgi:hypothetical protein
MAALASLSLTPRKDAPAKPYQKGDGASLMIADFVASK